MTLYILMLELVRIVVYRWMGLSRGQSLSPKAQIKNVGLHGRNPLLCHHILLCTVTCITECDVLDSHDVLDSQVVQLDSQVVQQCCTATLSHLTCEL